MQRYFLEIMYDGTAFHGSQLQGEQPTVQLALNTALGILLRTPITSFGASRTDEGVHALGNFYHFDHDGLHPHFHYKLNALLPATISVKRIFRCLGEPINARFDALRRTYRYRIYPKKEPFYYRRAYYYPFRLRKELLHETATALRAYTDFESFSKRNTQSRTSICNIYASRWEERDDQLHYVVTANRFLRGMVRGLVGTQLQVAREKISLDGFHGIIAAKDCTLADFSVPGYGLYLEEIIYPEGKLEELHLM